MEGRYCSLNRDCTSVAIGPAASRKSARRRRYATSQSCKRTATPSLKIRARYNGRMRRILLVKTSSLGDVVHNFPVATDLRARFPQAEIDWAVEASLSELPPLHPA